MNPKIEKLKAMITSNNAEAMNYLVELTAECETSTEKEQLALLASQILSEANHTISKIERETEELIVKQKLGELSEAINLSYIARNYFHKSKHWLYQRINGYSVNGQKTAFSEEELAKFNEALEDIRYKLGVFTSH